MNITLLKNLGFADIISSCEAVTESGKELINTYKSHLFNNPTTCGVVNGFVQEASKYGFDAPIALAVETIKKFISENKISWQLASACESIASKNSSYDYIAKLGIDQVQKLLEMKEADVVSYIKAGSLKSVQYIPEFRSVCKQVYKSSINEAKHVNYTMTSPITYVYVNENKEQFVQIGRHNYKIAEGKVEMVGSVDNQTFNYVNALLESFKHEGEDLVYEYKNSRGEQVRFILNESGLTFTKGITITEKFDDNSKFLDYSNILSKTMSMNEKLDFMNKCNAIVTVMENMSNIVVLDCAHIINTNNGFSGILIEGENNVNLSVLHSVNAGSSNNSYDYVIEAINNITKITGIDLSSEFADRINEDCKKQDPEAQEIKEQLEANREAQFNIRKKKIAMLAEAYKNDPVKIALLNKVAKDLNILESAI